MALILVVDDEYANVEILTSVLEGEGHRVVSAANGKDALERALRETPQLVLTDFMMPIADGRELVRSLRALPTHRSVPVVMMSAATELAALADPRGELEVSAFLRKPFRLEELLAIVTELLSGAV